MISPIEIELAGPVAASSATFTIRGLHTGSGNHHKILCVHGWLDNANSFLPLLSAIEDAEIVAIDLPGHGHSDHLPHIYSIADQAHILLMVANALEWSSFTIIGHSLGGCIAPFSVAASDNRIAKLILVEAIGPRSELPKALPKRLKKFHADMSQSNKYESRNYDSIDQAIESRLRANTMTRESARLIVERQLRQVTTDNQTCLQWRFDRKLRFTSPSYFTEEQVQAILKNIDCRVLVILAEQGYLVDRPETQARLRCIKDCKVSTLPGHHHLHLDDPEPVATAINQFL